MSRVFAQFKSFPLGGLRKAQNRISLQKLAVFLYRIPNRRVHLTNGGSHAEYAGGAEDTEDCTKSSASSASSATSA